MNVVKNKNKKIEKKNKSNRNINWKVVLYSIIALVCIYLMYKIDWIFIVPVLILIWLNQRELFGKK